MTAVNPTMPNDLLEAIKAGDVSRVRAMLEHDPVLMAAETEQGLTAVMAATYYNERDVVNLLLEHGAALDVFAAAALGEVGALHSLLATNPQLVQGYSSDGWTPLHLAAHFGQLETATLLLDAGADVAAESHNSMGNQPLHAALPSGHTALAELLLDRGADVNARQHGGFTALHAAAQNGDLASAELLLDRGADPSVTTDDGQSPLSYAIKGGHAGVASLLRAYGAM